MSGSPSAVVADVRQVRTPAAWGRLRMCFVPEVEEELLHSVLDGAGTPVRMEPCPPAAEPLIGAMESIAHSLAARARLAVQNRDMA